MARAANNQNRTEIVRSIALVALIIVMDLSGFSGLANQDRLEDVPDYRGTNSTDSDGDGVPDDEDDYPNDPYRVGPYQNEGIGHIILVSEGGQTGFNFDDVAITFVEYSSNISYLTDFDNLSVGTSVTDQYLSQGALYSAVNMDGSVTGTIGDLVNGTHGISDFGSSSPNAVIVGGLGAAVRIDIIDPDTGLAETAARGIEMRLGDGDSGSESFRVEVYDHNGSILHNESFTTYGGAVNGGVNFSYWYPSTTTNLTEDLDDDNDGILDINDAFPLDPTEDIDTDGDGVGDNADDDDDGDGVSDAMDAFPLDATEWYDTDLDGVGDNTDTDDDNDGSLDWDDAFPLDPSEDSDTDGDGVGDNADDDADDDGEVDNETALSIGPLNPSNSLKLSLLINLILVLLATLVISNRRSSSSSNLVGFEKMPEPQITTAVKDRKEVLEKYLSQGYSPELANTLADNEMRKN
ncbi:MAG: hypothetical protein VX999_05705 [Candidatus Thermoplasmatota archaeon]|nr:hypothetical protein [Candidatus Thermoplasmatota archaeon]